jgi:hypothetical protein
VYINIKSFKKLIKAKFKNNLHECARALKVNPSTVWRVVNENSNAGTKFLGNLIEYCNSNDLNFNDYIFLNKPLRATNSKIKRNTA